MSKSTPAGSIDHPLDPISMALAADASFVARSIDVHTRHLGETLRRAAAHRGTSFVEVYQNCNVFNDMAFEYAWDAKQRPEHVIELEHGRPMRFGGDGRRGIRLRGLRPEVVTVGENGVAEADLLVHDEHAAEPTLAWLLAHLRHPEHPEPIGVLRAVERPTYDARLDAQIAAATGGEPAPLEELFRSGDTWSVT